MRVEKTPKHLPIDSIGHSHNSAWTILDLDKCCHLPQNSSVIFDHVTNDLALNIVPNMLFKGAEKGHVIFWNYSNMTVTLVGYFRKI